MTDQAIRNIAIIAHVDHGKTTLVDGLLKRAGTFRTGEVVAERAMDSNDIERERGITILSKCTAVTWKDVRINIVDTPGHADFGGEVERVLGMVDSVLLLVDAYEGAMPQTRFVTQKAFAMGLSPIVVINKIDRPSVDPHQVMDQVFELFVSLGATDAQLDFPVIYASGRQGYAIRELGDEPKDLAPLLDLILEKVPPAVGDLGAPLLMQVATLDYDDYLGYMAIGRMRSGRSKVGDRVLLAHRDGTKEEFRVQKVLGFQGLKRFELAEAIAGNIVAFTGMENLNVGETITSIAEPTVLPLLKIDAPTITMNFRVNDGPFAGREGKFVTSRNLRERLEREIKSNVALRVEDTAQAGVFKVSGRGELHLSVLIENMRREGYELCVSQPQVILQPGPNGETFEPFEDA
ncbi:MAG TPA: GTP-binding protein, partial [Kofleriaceae bacterium]|nr:GTP-binding protein [Kofleriaceae bacterium]